jgi:hypothetical protein
MVGGKPARSVAGRAPKFSSIRGEWVGTCVALLFLVTSLGASAWIIQRRQAERQKSRFRGGTPVATRGDREQAGLPARLVGPPGQRAPGIARYFSNLATKAGNYHVSVRYIIGEHFQQGLLNNIPQERSPIPSPAKWTLAIQLIAEAPKELSRIRNFATRLIVEDEQGKRQELLPAQKAIEMADTRTLFRFYTLPKTEVFTLRSLEGEILLGPPGESNFAAAASDEQVYSWEPKHEAEGERLPFRLNHIPLPRASRLFGNASLAYLAPDQCADAMPLPEGFALITGQQAHSLTTQFTLRGPAPLELPCRLVIAPGLPAVFQVAIPAGRAPSPASPKTLETQVVARLGNDGEINLAAQFQSKDAPLRVSARIWNGEPVILLLPDALRPPDAPSGCRLAMRVRLSLDLPTDYIPSFSSRTPFPAQGKERGGVLVGQARVGREPMGFGNLRLSVQRQQGSSGAWGVPMAVSITLDKDGQWRFANLAPGRYRIRLTKFDPYRTWLARHSPLPDYLRRRYALQNPILTNEEQNDIVVRPGGYTSLRPFMVVDAPRSAQNSVPAKERELFRGRGAATAPRQP